MHWFSFVVGALVGWLVEWLIDVFYWRRRWSTCREEKARLAEELAAAKDEAGRLRVGCAEVDGLRADLAAAKEELAQLRSKGGEFESLRFELSAAESELARARMAGQEADRLRGELASAQAQIAGLQAQLTAPRTEMPAVDLSELNVPAADLSQPEAPDLGERAGQASLFGASVDTTVGEAAKSVLPDDLKVVEGIGPAIERVLNGQGIVTFADLANASQETLRRILADAGPRFRMADPGTWPGQALLAMRGEWDALKVMQDQLKGGR